MRLSAEIVIAGSDEDRCSEGVHYPQRQDPQDRRWVCRCGAKAVKTGIRGSMELQMLTRRPVSQYAKWEAQ